MSDSELISSYDSDSEMMDNPRRRQLFGQITELQSAVTDMKSAFTTAIHQLGAFQHEERDIWDKIESNKLESDNQVAEVLKLMLSMRSEFVTLKNQVQMSNEIQQNLQQQLRNLVWERNLLIEELYKSGSISEQIRYHLQNCHHHVVSRAASGTRSNDSGVAMFSEQAPLQSSFQSASLAVSSEQDNESINESSHAQESSLFHDYLAGLHRVKALGLIQSYDSESSLINAANKSLTLSSSLGKQCGLELDQSENNTDDDDEDTTATGEDTYKTGISPEETESSIVSSIPKRACEATRVETRRKLIVASIAETERSYCNILLTLREIFAEPLKRNGIISSKDSDTLFPNEIYQIYENHSTLLLDLEEATDGNVGRIFDKFTNPIESNILRLYTSYVDDFPEVLKVFHKLCRQKDKKFTNFLKSCLIQPECGGMDLGVFLVAPVQRIPRYVLYLKKLLQIGGENISDQQHLQCSLQRLKDFLERLNDTMEHSFKLIVSQIHTEKDRLHFDSCLRSSLVKDKIPARDVTNVSTDVQSIWRASHQFNNKECEESGYRGDGSGSGRCDRYLRIVRTNCQASSKCGYCQCHAEVPSIFDRCTFKAGSCNMEESVNSSNFTSKNTVKIGSMKDEETFDDGSHLMGALKVAREETDDARKSESHGFSRKVGVDGNCRNENAALESDCNVLSTDSTSQTRLNVKSKQTEECTSSEPNLADSATNKIVLVPRTQYHVRQCCCNSDKGASLECINQNFGEIGDEGLDPNAAYQSDQRPLAKSQSSFAVHHNHLHHHSACALAKNVATSHRGNVDIGTTAIAHSTSSPTLKEKKKISIRTSLKNLLLFKKRSSSSHSRHRSPALNNCSDCQKLHMNAESGSNASTRVDY